MSEIWIPFIGIGLGFVALVYRIEFLSGRVDTISDKLRDALRDIEKLEDRQ